MAVWLARMPAAVLLPTWRAMLSAILGAVERRSRACQGSGSMPMRRARMTGSSMAARSPAARRARGAVGRSGARSIEDLRHGGPHVRIGAQDLVQPPAQRLPLGGGQEDVQLRALVEVAQELRDQLQLPL